MELVASAFGLLSPLGIGRGESSEVAASKVDGFFPANSMIRRLHSERLIAFSGVRALLMQACDPLAVVGFRKHSILFDDPRTRLMSTDQRMSRMYFGDQALAMRTGEEIQAMHRKVEGKVKERYGPIARGTHYSASDPELMLWTLATLADSALLYWERIFGSLPAEESEAYWADYRQIGMLLGMPEDSMPASEPELREYVRGRLSDGSLYISPEVRDRSTGIIFDPPFEGWLKLVLTPVSEAIKLSSIGFLPGEIREMYGFGWDPARETLLRTSLLQIRIASRIWPDVIRRHPASREPSGALEGN
ncbi:MAG: oxygenase MpaB family protein [Solirubrobacterales bacterium]